MSSIDSFLADLVSVDHGADEVSVLSESPSTAVQSTDGSLTSKISRCIITIFPPDQQDKWLNPTTYYVAPDDVITLWCGQFEFAPSCGTLHAHIYVEFVRKPDKRPRFSALRKLFTGFFNSTVNIEPAKHASLKQRQCAINYVIDETKRVPNSVHYVWGGNKTAVAFSKEIAKQKPTKTDTETQRLWIESKPRWWSWDRVVHESEDSKKLLASCGFGKKYHEGRQAEVPRRTIQNVIILYGAGGTGKTTMAHNWDIHADEDFQERYYRRNPGDGTFWGGGRTAYAGQRVIHMEEFCGQEMFANLKEVCDIGKQGPSVNIKSSGTVLNHETVIFTSNHHPAGWYQHLWNRESKQFQPFWRRVTAVYFFPEERPDGTPNIPDTDNPPFFEDKTNEWLALKGDYGECINHASGHWPVVEPVDSNVVGDTAFSPTYNAPGDFFAGERSGKRRRT